MTNWKSIKNITVPMSMVVGMMVFFWIGFIAGMGNYVNALVDLMNPPVLSSDTIQPTDYIEFQAAIGGVLTITSPTGQTVSVKSLLPNGYTRVYFNNTVVGGDPFDDSIDASKLTDKGAGACALCPGLIGTRAYGTWTIAAHGSFRSYFGETPGRFGTILHIAGKEIRFDLITNAVFSEALNNPQTWNWHVTRSGGIFDDMPKWQDARGTQVILDQNIEPDEDPQLAKYYPSTSTKVYLPTTSVSSTIE